MQAEAVFTELKAHPEVCAQHLMRTLRHSPSLEARGLCAVLLRKVGGWVGGGEGGRRAALCVHAARVPGS